MSQNKEDQTKDESTNDEIVELYHLGEFLVSSLINSIPLGDFKEFLEKKAFIPRTGSNGVNKDIVDDIFGGVSNFSVDTFLRLHKDDFSFDSESDVDVGIFFSKGKGLESFCFPIEVKMGKSGMAASMSNFSRKMHEDPVKIQNIENQRRIKGCMPSLLSGYGIELHELLSINQSNSFNRYEFKVLNKKKQQASFKYWGLCILQQNKKKFIRALTNAEWKIEERECVIPVLPIVFTLEDLVSCVKLEKKENVKKEFQDSLNESATKIVNKVFDQNISKPNTQIKG